MNWGVPDWEDPAAYPDSLSENQWRWEFLRRNNSYREDWLRYFHSTYCQYIEEFKDRPTPEGVDSWEQHFSSIAEMPECLEKYGVLYLLDPSLPSPSSNLFRQKAGYVAQYVSDDSQQKLQEDNIKILSFDMNKPIKSQIKRAEKLLSRIQSESSSKVKATKQNKDKWPLYLRFIDARDTGLTWQAIGNILLADKNLESYSARAKEFHNQATGVQARQIKG